MAGMPLMIVAKELGHRDTTMVEKHYGHMSQDHGCRCHPPAHRSLALSRTRKIAAL
jgi:hypothetical protein